MANVHMGSELALEGIHVRAERGDPVGAEGFFDKGGFFFAQVRRREPDALGQFPPEHHVHRAVLCVQYRDVVDLVAVHQFEHGRGGCVFVHHLGGLRRQLAHQGRVVEPTQTGASQIAIGQRAHQLACFAEHHQQASGRGVQPQQGVPQRATGRHAQGVELCLIHETLLAGIPT